MTTDFLKVEVEYWKEQFEDEKKQSIPFSRCRICEKKFYADFAKKHARICKIKHQAKQDDISFNEGFLQIYSQATYAGLEKPCLIQDEQYLTLLNSI